LNGRVSEAVAVVTRAGNSARPPLACKSGDGLGGATEDPMTWSPYLSPADPWAGVDLDEHPDADACGNCGGEGEADGWPCPDCEEEDRPGYPGNSPALPFDASDEDDGDHHGT